MTNPRDRSAFGPRVDAAWPGDSIGYAYRNPEAPRPESLWERLPADVGDDVNTWIRTAAIASAALYVELPTDAEKMVMTAMINDATSLVVHVGRFDGRSAAHCARAAFEHLVNALDLASSPINTHQRYLGHQAITTSQVASRRWYLRLLSKPAQVKESRRLDKLARKTAADLKRVVQTYGSSFKKGWASGTLFDRATAHGLRDEYEGYRILSAVIHGSSRGMAGIVRHVNGSSVFRIGSDLDLAAIAWIEGIQAVLHYFEALVAQTQRPEAVAIRRATERMLAHTEVVRAELRRIDQEMWPAVPDLPPTAVLAIHRGGKERWFLYSSQTESLLAAETPSSLPPDTEASLEKIRAEAAKRNWDGGNGRPMTIHVSGAPLLVPKPGAKHVPAASIMFPAPVLRVERIE